MSNTSKGPGKKGSKLWIQFLANYNSGSELTKCIRKEDSTVKDILWLSPLASDNYAEYMLNSPVMLKKINDAGIPISRNQIHLFWPSRGPDWDAIGIGRCSNNEKPTLYLVEAKAHISEMNSKKDQNPATYGSAANLTIIQNSMLDSSSRLGSTLNIDIWMNKYYQLGNRLTFLDQLNKYFSVKLVLLNIVNDETYNQCSQSEWESHYNQVFTKMLGTCDISYLKSRNIFISYSIGKASILFGSESVNLTNKSTLSISSSSTLKLEKSAIARVKADIKSGAIRGKAPRNIGDGLGININVIPSDLDGSCCDTLITFCYEDDSFEGRLEESFDHLLKRCKDSKYFYFYTYQWYSDKIKIYGRKILQLKAKKIQIHFIYFTDTNHIEMPY